MAWYLGQSWLIILLSILLGLLIGWALWRRPWHKRYFSESEAITKVTREHAQALADKDRALGDRDRTLADKEAEITRLRGLLDRKAADAVPAPAATMAGTAPQAEAAAATGTDDELSAQTAELRMPTPTAESVDIQDVEAPDVDMNAPSTGEIDISAIQAASVDVSDDTSAASQVAASEETESQEPASQEPASQEPASQEPASQEPASQVSGSEATTSDGAPNGTSAAAADGASTATREAAAEADAGQDDLERIEGVGPRIASALQAAGIGTFCELADSDVAALQSALERAGLRFAPSLPTWSRQARLLADGDETGFVQLTEQLVAGRDVGRRG